MWHVQTASKFGDLVQVTCSATFATAALACTNLVSAFLSKHSRKTCSPFHDSSLPVLRSPSVAMLLAAVWWRTKICLLTIGGEGMPKKQLEAIQLFHIYTYRPIYMYNYIFDWHKIGSNCRQGLFARGVKILRCPAGRSQWVHHWLNGQMCAISEDKLQQSWSILYRFLHFFTVLSLPPSLPLDIYVCILYTEGFMDQQLKWSFWCW